MRINNSEIFIFFDDGNVLNDNKIRGRQWQQLVGEFLSPKFGGDPKIWGAANAEIIKDFTGGEVPKLIYENRDKSHELFMDWFIEKWINEMFDFVGVKRPGKQSYKEIYYNAAQFVDLRVKAVYPGVIKSIKKLYDKGYNLCTSSGTESIELKFYLEGMGVKQFFKKFYGPDLINILKVDDAFYRAIFKDLAITPKQAIIIDDKPYYLDNAEKLGANVIQACLSGEFNPQFPYIITNMKNIAQIIEEVIDNNINNYHL
ncbi:MAG: HAD hydrolase-like protein [Candidatus Lokiarchaeota archaeon]|nr:HAD hydrolase-like protein [Candidatus Lokiarchaeota archaeon]